MKTRTLIQAAMIAAVAVAPALSFAQTDTNGPVTRAQVRQELIDLEKAGYNPATANEDTYPADIQAAEARVQAQHEYAKAHPEDGTGYGPGMTGTKQGGTAPRTSP